MVINMLGAQDIGRLIFILVLLCVSALISGSETAFFSLSPQNLNELKTNQTRSGNTVLKLLAKPESLLATILITNNLVNISIVILSNAVIDSWIDFQGSGTLELLVKLVMVTFLLLLFGEIMPKIFASYKSMKTALFMAVPLLFLRGFFKPVSFILIKSGNLISRRASRKKINISMDELSNALEMTSDQTVEEKKILTGIVDFVNTEVEEIMKHRVDIVALDTEDDFTKVKEVIMSSGFSRIPVYESSLDNIRGVLYIKDVLPHIAKENTFDWKTLCRKPYFVHEHKKINDLLEEFQTQKIHMAIVVDEYGSTQGLVSLEDILEEIVGEISDESDMDHSFYTKLDDNTYLFDGKTHLGDVLRVMDLDDEYLDAVKGEAESIAGLMLEIHKDFLKPGEQLECLDLTLTAQTVEGHRVDQVKVHLLPASSDTQPEEA